MKHYVVAYNQALLDIWRRRHNYHKSEVVVLRDPEQLRGRRGLEVTTLGPVSPSMMAMLKNRNCIIKEEQV